MAYDLDPEILDFLRRRQGGEVAPEAEPNIRQPTVDLPPPAPQSQPDPELMRLLGEQDAEAKDFNSRQALKEGVGNSMNYFLRRPVNQADVGPRKIDDSMRRYLISRKAGAQQTDNPLDAQLKTLRAKLLEKELNAPPKPEKAADPDDAPADEQTVAYARRLGIDPGPFRSRGELMGAIRDRLRAGFQADAAGRKEDVKTERLEKRETGKALVTFDTSLAEIEAIKAEVKKNPAAFSTIANLSDYMGEGPLSKVVGRVQSSNRSPRDTETRAAVLRQAYKVKNDLAGAAVSTQEKASIDAFNPSDNDTAPEIVAKLDALLANIKVIRAARANKGQAPAAAPTPAPVPTGPARPGDKYLQ